jgi:methylated-DNA-[protein]-cysteine S-methyltransferase
MERLPAFQRRVYEAAREIPPGTTVSYGDLAARLGSPGAARAVGQALGRNPFAIVVPCHRVLAAGGRMGGFSAKGGVITKARLLALESEPADGGAPSFDAAEALRHLRAADAGLARLIDAVGPFALRLERAPSLFLALAEAIVYQQLHAKAAATIFARVGALFPRSRDGFTARQVLRVSEARLLAAGLSRAKMLSLRDLARRVQSGELPSLEDVQGMEDEAIIESLSQVRGIGRWTAQMLLIFRLGRPDVLPVDDYGVRQGFALAFRKRGVPKPADLEKRGRRWQPYRTVAAWYLWRALDHSRSELLTKASIRPSGDQEGTLMVP